MKKSKKIDGLIVLQNNNALTAKARLIRRGIGTVTVELLEGILAYKVGDQLVVNSWEFTPNSK